MGSSSPGSAGLLLESGGPGGSTHSQTSTLTLCCTSVSLRLPVSPEGISAASLTVHVIVIPPAGVEGATHVTDWPTFTLFFHVPPDADHVYVRVS